MTDKPILFSAPMVRAILDGRKTVTRRILKLPTKAHSGPIYERRDMGGWEPTTNGGAGCFTIGKGGECIAAPETIGIWHRTCGVCLDAPYQAGDRLWVREACWIYGRWYQEGATKKTGRPRWCFRPLGRSVLFEKPADSLLTHRGGKPGYSHRQSIHMPRWATRVFPEVVSVRVERLQDITEADAIPEGLTFDPQGGWSGDTTDNNLWDSTPRSAYRALFDRINGPGSWEANPWVVAVEFRRVADAE